jgi:hypothetical protein
MINSMRKNHSIRNSNIMFLSRFSPLFKVYSYIPLLYKFRPAFALSQLFKLLELRFIQKIISVLTNKLDRSQKVFLKVIQKFYLNYLASYLEIYLILC